MEPRIRRFQKKDLELLYELLSDREVMRFIEPPFDLERAVAFLEKAGLSDPPLIYAVEDSRGMFAGYVIYHGYDSDSIEIGWILKKEMWGKGLAGSLTTRLIEKAKSERKSVVIECDPEQAVTKHIAEKFGFTLAGCEDGLDIYRLELPGDQEVNDEAI